MPHETEQPLRTSPAEWVKKTALTVSRRPPSLVKVDVAYANFFSAQSNMLLAGHLLDALEVYKREVGGNWKTAERNVKSGGLIALTHARLLQEAKRKGWWKAGTGDKGADALANVDIPHSRYGVLFLLGNTQVGIDTWSVALEGVSAVGGAVAMGFATDTTHLDSAKLANPTSHLYGQDIQQSSLVGLGAIVPKAGAKKLAAPGLKIPAKTYGEPPEGRSYGFPCTKAGIAEISEDPFLFLNPFVLPATLVVGAGLAVADLLHNLRNLLMDLVEKLFNFVKSKIMVDSAWPWDISGLVIKKMIKLVVAKCLTAAAPLIGGVMDIGTGLMKTFAAARDRLGVWLLRRKLQLNEGHPTLLANAIEGEMSQGIFNGLWTLLKGIASLALQSFLPGAGNLVNAVVTGIEWMVKALWRMWEESKISKFLMEAKGHFVREKALAKPDPAAEGRYADNGFEFNPNLDPRRKGMIHDVEAFKAFYKRGCDASPVIPMLTLNSGVCGSLMTLLKMFEGREQRTVTSPQAYMEGAEYFQRLKEFGMTYLKKSGFKFTSTHPSVNRYLGHAVSHHNRVKSTGDKAMAVLAAG